MKTTRDAKVHTQSLLPTALQHTCPHFTGGLGSACCLRLGNIFPNIIGLGISWGNQSAWKHLGRSNRNQSPPQKGKDLEKQGPNCSTASSGFTARGSRAHREPTASSAGSILPQTSRTSAFPRAPDIAKRTFEWQPPILIPPMPHGRLRNNFGEAKVTPVITSWAPFFFLMSIFRGSPPMLLLDFMGSVAPGLLAAPIAMEYSTNTVFQRRQHSPDLLIHLCKDTPAVPSCLLSHRTRNKS